MFTIYTKDFGKITVEAQGVKKESAKLKGHLEPLLPARIGFVTSKRGMRLVYASMRDFWPGVRQDLGKLIIAFRMADAIDEMCLEGERDENVWNEILKSFLLLGKENAPFTGDSRGFSERALQSAEIITNAGRDFFEGFKKRLTQELGYGG